MSEILVLKKPGQSLREIEAYFSSRKIVSTYTETLREAVQFITERKPDYALIAAELMPVKARWIYGVLNQLSPIILFSDRVNAKTLAVRREVGENERVRGATGTDDARGEVLADARET